MSLLFALDPGTLQSALVVLDGSRVVEHRTVLNPALLPALAGSRFADTLVIEQIEAMGMAVGHDVFETVFWTGRFYEAWPTRNRYRLTRRAVKLHLCGSMQAKDANIRMALLDRYGPGEEAAIGRVKTPGPLYGVKGHEFAALAVGVTWLETHGSPRLQAPARAQPHDVVG